MSIIDAITGPTIKPGDLPAGVDISAGSGKNFAAGLRQEVKQAMDSAIDAARPMVQNVSQALEPAQQIVAGAKTLMSDPLRYLSQAATKAIPAAIAASASLQYTGGQGSFSNFLYPWVVRSKYLRVDGNRGAYIGKPLCKVRPLFILSGYCKCQNVRLNLSGSAQEPPATLDEQEIVVRYLEAGVFIE